MMEEQEMKEELEEQEVVEMMHTLPLISSTLLSPPSLSVVGGVSRHSCCLATPPRSEGRCLVEIQTSQQEIWRSRHLLKAKQSKRTERVKPPTK